MPFWIETPNGEKYPVGSSKSKKYYNGLKDKYLQKYKFEQIADLDVLHELLMCYTHIFELNQELAGREDHPKRFKLHDTIKSYKKEINKLQDTLNISAKAREKNTDRNSTGEYITNLLKRAKYFKESRDKQYEKAREIINEFKTLTRMFKICNAEEKRVAGIQSPQDIINKITKMIKEYDEIDKPIKEKQKEWGLGDDDW